MSHVVTLAFGIGIGYVVAVIVQYKQTAKLRIEAERLVAQLRESEAHLKAALDAAPKKKEH